jgi:hydrogenase maturation protease
MAEKLAIIGMGNQEMGDDGIGVYLVEKLKEELACGAWTPEDRYELELVSAGTDSILAGACLAEAARAILLDAADMRASPGEMRFFSAEEADLGAGKPSGSTHSLPLGGILDMIRSLGCPTRLRIAGIQPASVHPAATLSRTLEERVPEMLSKIKEEVSLLP